LTNTKNKLFQAALDAMDARVVLVDADGRVAHANRAALGAMGVPGLEAAVGMPVDDARAFAPHLALGLPSPYERARVEGRAVRERYRLRGASGEADEVELSVHPVAGSEYLLAVVHEVKGGERIEHILERYAEGLTVLYEISSEFLSSAAFEAALDVSLEMIRSYYSADVVRVVVPLDAESIEVVGERTGAGLPPPDGLPRREAIRRDDLAGRCVLDQCPHIVADYAASTDVALSAADKARNVGSGMGVPMVADAQVFGVLVLLYQGTREIDTAELWYLNVLANTLAVFVQRERTLKRVAESESFQASVLDAIGEGVAVVSRDHVVISANRAFCAIVGLAEEETVGRNCMDLGLHGSEYCDDGRCLCPMSEVFEGGVSRETVYAHMDREGRHLHVSINAYPVRDASGRVWAAVQTVMDVTDKRLLELDLEKRVRELEEFYDMAVGRELRMIELKEEIERLKQAGPHTPGPKKHQP
jgi:PAS domain S-box-containing protein